MATLFAPSIARRPMVAASAALGVVTAVCWAYLLAVQAAMGTMDSTLAMPMTSAWTTADVTLMWAMWAVMMAAMMLPSATPMVTAYARTISSTTVRGSTAFFVGGYVALWSGFALLATGVQWTLRDGALVDVMGASTSRWLSGAVLLLAGSYQFSRLKHIMLSRCRTPLGFLLTEWRSGRRGALVMGLRHGVLCLGCCWALMALLFVVGVMNLWWVAVLTTVVLVEKVTRSAAVPRVFGAVLLMAGVLVLSGVVA